METIDVHWLVATLIEGGRHPLKLFIPLSIILRNLSKKVMRREGLLFSVICMVIVGNKISSFTGAIIRSFPKRPASFRIY